MGQAIRQKVVSQPGLSRFWSYQKVASESWNKTPFFLQLLNNHSVDWKDAGEIGIMVSLPKKEPGHEEFIQAGPNKRDLGSN